VTASTAAKSRWGPGVQGLGLRVVGFPGLPGAARHVTYRALNPHFLCQTAFYDVASKGLAHVDHHVIDTRSEASHLVSNGIL